MWIDDAEHKEFVKNCKDFQKILDDYSHEYTVVNSKDTVPVSYFSLRNTLWYIQQVLEHDRKQMIKIYSELEKLNGVRH